MWWSVGQVAPSLENCAVVEFESRQDAAISPTVSLSSPSSSISILDGSESFADLPEDGDISLPAALQFQVAVDATPGERINLRLDFSGTNYADFQFLPAVLEPEYKTHDLNQLQVSLTSTGNIGWIGFAGGLAGEKGKGFQFSASNP